MARFTVVRKLPAAYTEVYVVDAGSEDEARRAVKSGRARFNRRFFHAASGMETSPAEKISALEELASVSGEDGVTFDVETLKAFSNGYFQTMAGDSHQFAIQISDEA